MKKFVLGFLLSASCFGAPAQSILTAEGLTIFSGTLSTSSPVDYKTVLLADSPNHLWLFNDASGQVTDYAGSANLSIPSGLTLGASGLLGSQGYTAGIDDGTANLHSSNINDFDYNDSYSYEFVFEQTNSRSGTQSQYVLASKLANSGAFDGYEINLTYNVPSAAAGSHTPDGVLIPSAWMTVSFFESDTGVHYYSSFAACDITNGVPVHLVCTYDFSNNIPDFRCYLNGNPIQMTYGTNGTLTSIKNNRNLWLLARTNNAVSAFNGKIQAIASFTNVLTEQQILNHYLAFQSQYYYSNQFIYSAYKGLATDGSILRISAGSTLPLASSNCYYIYGTGYSGLDFVRAGAADQYAVSNVTVYVSTNLYRGTYAKSGSSGIAFTATNIASLWGNIRPTVVYNPNTSKYVMWSRMTLNEFYNPTTYLITESDSPSGPFSVITANYLPNSLSPSAADMTIFADGANGYVCYGDNTNTYVSALASDFHSTVGNAYIVDTNSMEGQIMFRRGNYYFIVEGNEEYYNSMIQTNIIYMVSTNPTNGYSAPVSVYANNPLGSGYDGQTTSGVFQLLSNTNRYIAVLDYWHNGYLNRSTVNYMEITFPTSNTLVFNPGKEIPLP